VVYACQRAGILKIGFITDRRRAPRGGADAMNLARARAGPEVMVDINTTPLIDVMLVLLIMLIHHIPIRP